MIRFATNNTVMDRGVAYSFRLTNTGVRAKANVASMKKGSVWFAGPNVLLAEGMRLVVAATTNAANDKTASSFRIVINGLTMNFQC